jgi:hypothetical protein
MKGFKLLILLTVLLLSDYALAQIPSCPCDTAELSNGLTGNEIVELLCPGGELGEGIHSEASPNSVSIVQLDPPMIGYAAFAAGENLCSLGLGGASEVAIVLNDLEFENCKARLIEGCNLLSKPIPTLSQWGLIATAGILGITGLFFTMRRRKAAANS